MYQDLAPVQGDSASLSSTQHPSFDSDDGYPPPSYNSYSYEAGLSSSSQVYSSVTSNFNSHQMVTPQQSLTNGCPENDSVPLPAIVNRPDLQWITTSSTDMRVQSPLSSSSPRPLPPLYPTQSSTPNCTLHHQGSLEDNSSSSATVTHHQFNHPRYPANNLPEVGTSQRPKKATNSSKPQKPKGTPGRKRKFQDHELPPAEAAKRHVRRERNKVAAAKCRNRRRELTDRLQGETDQLEDHQNMLHQEIMALQQEKEHLEFILAAHNPNCKANLLSIDTLTTSQEDSRTMGANNMSLVPPPEGLDDILGSVHTDTSFYYMRQPQQPNIPMSNTSVSQDLSPHEFTVPFEATSDHVPEKLSNPIQSFPSASNAVSHQNLDMNLDNLENVADAPLDTPVCTLATPSNTSTVFTFPTTASNMNTMTDNGFAFSEPAIPDFNQPALRPPATPTLTASVTSFPANSFNRLGQNPQSCSAAHRRSSSSESHHSPDSVKSPTLLAL